MVVKLSCSCVFTYLHILLEDDRLRAERINIEIGVKLFYLNDICPGNNCILESFAWGKTKIINILVVSTSQNFLDAWRLRRRHETVDAETGYVKVRDVILLIFNWSMFTYKSELFACWRVKFHVKTPFINCLLQSQIRRHKNLPATGIQQYHNYPIAFCPIRRLSINTWSDACSWGSHGAVAGLRGGNKNGVWRRLGCCFPSLTKDCG